MLGAIIGDMVGSPYEFNPIKRKDFDIFSHFNRITDDSALTIAVARTIEECYPIDYSDKGLNNLKKKLISHFVKIFNSNQCLGYGEMFFRWAKNPVNKEPYNSFGNGSAMRISPVAWVVNNEHELKNLSKAVTEVTHNHPEGIKGAEAIAMCIFMAKNGCSKEEIKERMIKDYYPEIANLSFEKLVEEYSFSEICQKSCPQAIYCFLISNSLEDCLRNCVAIGGDCDTTGAMAGAIAEAFYEKDKLSDFSKMFLYLSIDPSIESEIKKFYKLIGNKKFE